MTDTTTQAVTALLDGVTPGPWDWQVSRVARSVELSGGRQSKAGGDLTVMSFARWGTQQAAPVFYTWEGNYAAKVDRADKIAVPEYGREHHAEWFARIDHPDARFIAAARDLVPALLAERDALLAERDAAELRARESALDAIAAYGQAADAHAAQLAAEARLEAMQVVLELTAQAGSFNARTAENAKARVAELEAALKKIATGTAPEADPDTGELIECWMDADEMREIAIAAIRAADPVTKSS